MLGGFPYAWWVPDAKCGTGQGKASLYDDANGVEQVCVSVVHLFWYFVFVHSAADVCD